LEILRELRVHRPASAASIFAGIEARIAILEHFPEVGARHPELADDARMLVEPPYLVMYRLVASGVQIVRVVHGVRRVDAALFTSGLEW